MDGKKSKILVADDEGEIREIVGLLLEGEGYEVVTAENGQEALELADSSVDLYILDVNMPVLRRRQRSGRASMRPFFF